jgi:hypothetical protein
MIGVNERGLRIGQYHQSAKLKDAQVEELLDLRADGWGYKRLAKHFDISKAQVRRIVGYMQRVQLSYVWRALPVPAPKAEEVVRNERKEWDHTPHIPDRGMTNILKRAKKMDGGKKGTITISFAEAMVLFGVERGELAGRLRAREAPKAVIKVNDSHTLSSQSYFVRSELISWWSNLKEKA